MAKANPFAKFNAAKKKKGAKGADAKKGKEKSLPPWLMKGKKGK